MLRLFDQFLYNLISERKTIFLFFCKFVPSADIQKYNIQILIFKKINQFSKY